MERRLFATTSGNSMGILVRGASFEDRPDVAALLGILALLIGGSTPAFGKTIS